MQGVCAVGFMRGPLFAIVNTVQEAIGRRRRRRGGTEQGGEQQLIPQAVPIAEVDCSGTAAHLGGPERWERRVTLAAAQAFRNISLMNLLEGRRENAHRSVHRGFRSHRALRLLLRQPTWLSVSRLPSWSRAVRGTSSVENKPPDDGLKHGQPKAPKHDL